MWQIRQNNFIISAVKICNLSPGMTLLVPYILSQRKQWKNAKLRVFCLGTKKEEVAEDQMRYLLLESPSVYKNIE